MITVVKRDGTEERFSTRKLYKSIVKAVTGAGFTEEDARLIHNQVIGVIHGNKVDSKTLADTIEKTIIERILENPRWEEAAKRYALARIYNQVYGKGAWQSFDPIDMRFSFNAIKIMEARYLIKDPETLRYKETPSLLLKRVARFLARVEERYGGDMAKWEKEFFRLLAEQRFLPNTPTLMNADTKLGILSACFVVPVRDSMTTPDGEGIMDALRAMALIHKDGGGTGFDFSELRPEGDIVGSTAGVSSGPLSFMRMFDVVTDVVKQGGKRRGANMGIMHVWHPDIRKFIKAKTGKLKDVHLQNFNISVGIYDYFMKKVEEGGEVPLINPRKTLLTGKNGIRDSRYYALVMARNSIEEPWVQEELIRELEENGGSIPYEMSRLITIEEALSLAEHMDAITGKVNARKLFEEIVMGAWDSGDPGIVFIDEMNRRHPVWYLGTINATNPCVTGDTLITTSKGLVRADSLTTDMMLWTPYGWAPIKEVLDNGVKPVYELVFDNGIRLKTTPEHKLYTKKGWLEAEKLEPGDTVRLVIEEVPEFPDAKFDNPTEIPDEIVAEFLGLWVGDGYLSLSGHVGIAIGHEEELVEYAREMFERLFGYAMVVQSSITEKTYGDPGFRVDIHRKRAVQLLEHYFPELRETKKSISKEKRVPEPIFKAPKKVIAAFLRGLFTADGTVSYSKGSIQVALWSTSKRLLEEVQQLLLVFGITSKISVGKKDTYRLWISGWMASKFINTIGFLGSKQEKAIKLLAQYEKGPRPPNYGKIAWVKLVSKTKVGEERVYDVVSPPFYIWTTNGVVSLDCGEQPLLPWENCNLGSINLEKYVVKDARGARIDWEGLARDVKIAIRFLDNVIDANRHPLEQITMANRRTRKVGLGVMGWAHMLIRLGVRYDSPDAIRLAWAIGEWIAYNSYLASIELAREKGTFPAWDPEKYRPIWATLPYKSPEEYMHIAGVEDTDISETVKRVLDERPRVDWRRVEEDMKRFGLRNAAVLSIAPTGTISILSGTSSSIEPLFALAFMRFVSVGQFIEVNQLFLEELRRYELDEPEVIIEIAKTGSIAHNKYIPRRLRRIYRTAHDIDPEWHLLHQAVWQAWVDAGVSKTINLRHDEPPSTVWKVYTLAWKLGVKGTTVYRDKSKSQQVIHFGIKKEEGEKEKPREKTVESETPSKAMPDPSIEEPPKPVVIIPGAPSSSGGEPQGGEDKVLEERGYTRKKVRLGRGKVGEMIEVVVASEDYAGGCVDCEF